MKQYILLGIALLVLSPIALAVSQKEVDAAVNKVVTTQETWKQYKDTRMNRDQFKASLDTLQRDAGISGAEFGMMFRAMYHTDYFKQLCMERNGHSS